MRDLLLSSILLVGLLAGCTSHSPDPTGSESVPPTATLGPMSRESPLTLNITGDIGLRLAIRGPEKCGVHVAAVFRVEGPSPWMFVLEERTGARYLYGHIGPSAHALQADTFPAGASHLEGENVSVGAGATDSVTIALKNLEWAPNPVTGNSTLRVWTDCRVADVQRFSFVGLADDYSFRGGAGANSIVANVNVNDQWSITVPGNATLIGRHEVNTVFRMDIQTPSGPMLWEKPLFVAQGPAGRYNATVTNASDGFLMLAVLA